jgi:histidine triad (HIT) family protein
MKDCVFCKIVKGELPSWKIYEDQNFLAFLDIAQFCDGHTLVIPKKHYRWVWDYPEIDQYFAVAGKVINHYRRVTKNDFVASVIWGKDIPHAHIQILPGPHRLSLNWRGQGLSEKKAKELVKKLAIKQK